MKMKIWSMFFMLFVVFGMYSCSKDESPSVNPPEEESANPLEKVSEIVVLNDGIGAWDEAYLTPKGYFCYANDVANIVEGTESETRSSSAATYEVLNYTNAEGSEHATVIISKKENLPVRLYTKDGSVNMSYLNDSIMELVYDNGSQVMMIDSISYDKKELKNIVEASGYSNKLQSTLCVLIQLIDGHVSEYPFLTEIITIFKPVLYLNYSSNTEILNTIELPKEDGVYIFVIIVNTWCDEVVAKDYFQIGLWTGKASFKVGGSSCTLSGSIFCSSPTFNDYGTYGIICDENIENLTLERAGWTGQGFQSNSDLSFDVDFRGFKPNTTYYYRAYYKFNSSDHGNLELKYGEPGAQVGYDSVIKSFTTGDNILNVDVVMCIDVTGSMSGIINTVKRNAQSFYDVFKNRCDENGIILQSVNTQVIAFQDINVDGDRAMIESPTYSMPEDTDEFNTFVSNLYADWGGDLPESGLEALDRAFSKTDWGKDDGYHRQVVILWTDAPYLIGSEYTDLTPELVEEKWNTLPSGRRLILFAPYGTYGSNGGDWAVMDDWKNTIHDDDLSSGFSDFTYILDSIISELTGRSSRSSSSTKGKVSNKSVMFRPN